jgi:hypothetical protein
MEVIDEGAHGRAMGRIEADHASTTTPLGWAGSPMAAGHTPLEIGGA